MQKIRGVASCLSKNVFFVLWVQRTRDPRRVRKPSVWPNQGPSKTHVLKTSHISGVKLIGLSTDDDLESYLIVRSLRKAPKKAEAVENAVRIKVSMPGITTRITRCS